MAPHAKIFIFDDSRESVETVTRILANAGHRVVGTANYIDDLKTHVRGASFDVALIDNQAPWTRKEFDRGEADPKGVGRIAEKIILGSQPDAVTIAFTSTESHNYGDYHFDPANGGDIGSFISSLPKRARR